MAAAARLRPPRPRGLSNLDAARFRWTRWLVWALLAEVLLVASTVALQVVGAHGPLVEHRGVLLAAFMVLTVYGTGYMALSQPELFVGQPHGEPALKYGRSSLTPSHAEEGARVIPARAAPNHSPYFTVDDTALVVGLRALAGLAISALQSGTPTTSSAAARAAR